MIENAAIQTGLNHQVPRPFQGLENNSHSRQGKVVSNEDFNLATDLVSLSYSSESIMTYDSNMTLQGSRNDGFDLLRGLVLNMFKEQGLSLNLAVETSDGEPLQINLEELTQEEAAAFVADDGYFGVEQTSDRIVNFAIGIAGNDPARIDAIKAGVEQGFNDALEAFGGYLPDISYKTYDAVFEKIDAFFNEGN